MAGTRLSIVLGVGSGWSRIALIALSGACRTMVAGFGFESFGNSAGSVWLHAWVTGEYLPSRV